VTMSLDQSYGPTVVEFVAAIITRVPGGVWASGHRAVSPVPVDIRSVGPNAGRQVRVYLALSADNTPHLTLHLQSGVDSVILARAPHAGTPVLGLR